MIASSTETVCALECGDRLVGRSHECDFPAWVKALPAVTEPKFDIRLPSRGIDARIRALVEQVASPYRIDAAALASLEPDLILTQTQCDVCAVNLSEVEAAVAATFPSRPEIVSMQPDSLASLWRDMRRIADALGVPERGVQLVSRLQRRLRSIAERLEGRPRPRVAFVEWIEPLMLSGHWTPELIALAGAEDLFGSPGMRTGRIPLRQLAAADPDVVFVAPCGFDLARTRAEMEPLTSDPKWQGLRAVREGRVFLADGNALFNRPGPRVAEALECLAEALHPGAFRFGQEGRGWERFEARQGQASRATVLDTHGGRR